MNSSHDAPPRELDVTLQVDPDEWHERQLYFLMTGLVIPRPIAWVSTLAADGKRNLAPHSYFNVVSSDPPHVVFGSTGVKDTLRNINESGEFVVNLVSMELVEEMNFTATDFPADEDEFDWAGLEAAPSRTVAAPRVARAKAQFECRLVQVVPAGSGNIVIGKVSFIHIDPSVWREGRVDPELLDPVCRLSGTGYAGLGEIFKLPRPAWTEVAGSAAQAAMPRRNKTGSG